MRKSTLVGSAIAILLSACASPPKAVQIEGQSTPYATAHRQCSAEMHASNSPGRNPSTGYATGAITSNLMSTFAHLFQADSMGYDVYRACMFRNGWRLEKE